MIDGRKGEMENDRLPPMAGGWIEDGDPGLDTAVMVMESRELLPHHAATSMECSMQSSVPVALLSHPPSSVLWEGDVLHLVDGYML